MEAGAIAVPMIDAIARETALFAAIWFVIGGIDDLAIDFAYLFRRIAHGWRARRAAGRLADQRTAPPLDYAILVPAWDEAAVIGAMLRAMLARLDHPRFHVFVGTYPNDPATIEAVAEVAAADARVHLVIGPHPGATTKGDCLNTLWSALCREEAARGRRFDAVVLHDAEDVVHPAELATFDRFLGDWDGVQLPVLPLVDPASRLVGGHYADEFAEAHAKQLWVREMVGRGLPFAGVGCAIRREMLGAVAAARGGDPFDATSLTEDYELGLAIGAMGGRVTIARVSDAAGGLVAVRAYFPGELGAAIRQKARWMVGIALAGWDRIGWSRARDIGDHWMRMRDRRVALSIPVLAIAYVALVAWGLSLAVHAALGTTAPTLPEPLPLLLGINLVLLGWRIAARAAFVGRAYGPVEALWSVPRMLVGNLIALLAARRAIGIYRAMLRGRPPRWDKTAHRFPATLGETAG